MKTFFISLMTVMILFSGSQLAGQDAAAISKKSMDVVDMGSIQMDLTIHILDNKGNDRIRKIRIITGTFDDVSKTLIRFIAPPEVKGTSLLIYDYEDKDDDMWIYMPALRKVRRIVSSEKGKSFMGSEFTNADMSRPNQADFNYEILGTELYEGKMCWKIESAGISSDVRKASGYSKTISFIDQENYLCHKVEYYDLSGSLHRIQYISDFRKQKGSNYIACRMTMENIQNKRISQMTIDHFETGMQFSENAFSPSILQQ